MIFKNKCWTHIMPSIGLRFEIIKSSFKSDKIKDSGIQSSCYCYFVVVSSNESREMNHWSVSSFYSHSTKYRTAFKIRINQIISQVGFIYIILCYIYKDRINPIAIIPLFNLFWQFLKIMIKKCQEKNIFHSYNRLYLNNANQIVFLKKLGGYIESTITNLFSLEIIINAKSKDDVSGLCDVLQCVLVLLAMVFLSNYWSSYYWLFLSTMSFCCPTHDQHSVNVCFIKKEQ